MRFFSKLTFIWNLCFIGFVILRKLEMNKRVAGNQDALIPLPFLEGLVAILGSSAIFINLVFIIVCLGYFFAKRVFPFAKWIWWFNFLILLVQIYYFFFYNE